MVGPQKAGTVLEVFEANRMAWLAVGVSALLMLVFLAAAIASRKTALWGLTAFTVLIFVGALAAARKPARLVLRITTDGFQVFRRWEVAHGVPIRNFVQNGAFFPWSNFSSVALETRNAAFVGNTKETVLRLKVRSSGDLLREWSHDETDPDFLVQASEQNEPKQRLLQLFEKGIRNGFLDPKELATAP